MQEWNLLLSFTVKVLWIDHGPPSQTDVDSQFILG